jgi:stage II sporulation protein D
VPLALLVLSGHEPSVFTVGVQDGREQIAPTDAQLDAASGGSVVMLGPAAGGRSSPVPLEVYVSRVIAGEGEPRSPEATQQALAIAIRTYALANLDRHARDGFNLCDGTHCQVPRAATPASRRAALSTAGRLLTYNGAPAEVFYSASCGGSSEDASQVWPGADFPYLKPVLDDVHEEDVPWTLERTLGEVRQALLRAGHRGARLTDLEVEARSASGRAVALRAVGLTPAAVRGEALRAALGPAMLRSTAFTVQRRGGSLVFSGRGYGHGVGLCVVGARRRAQRGESVEQILSTYYPGLILSDLRERTAEAPAQP